MLIAHTCDKMPELFPLEILTSHDTIQAKWKLTLILRSKSTNDSLISIGDMIQIFIKKYKEKRGKWSAPKPVSEHDWQNHTVTVPETSERKNRLACEDTRVTAVLNDTFAIYVQEAIDSLNFTIDQSVDSLCYNALSEEPDTTLSFDANMDISNQNDLSKEFPSVRGQF